MEYLGHANAEETMTTYAKLWPDSQDRAREAIMLAFTPKAVKDATRDGAGKILLGSSRDT